ncbi:hypothetical protein [Embleya sp. NBC_00896]|uniref:hypothetical protein n=1 Tax=Embleya sp. NBC_00896 TaxID=2975961 RepID=UPI003862EABE|nr:hypothetical protein OG928_31290 [Embleya sp. NBC_00896]
MTDPERSEPPGHRRKAAPAAPAAPAEAGEPAERAAIPMMAIGHAAVDFYQGAVPCLVPFLVAERLSAGGLGATPWLMAPAVAGVLVTAAVIRRLARHAAAARAGARANRPDDWPAFLRLSAVIVCRSIVFVGLGTFIALFAETTPRPR